ncbi:MAG: HPF/RaiA family ribosome-associated protein [Acidobacteriota bacterium]
MSIKIQNRKFEPSQSYEKVVDRQSRKILKLLPTFSPDTFDLNVVTEKLVRGSQYVTSITLNLPQRTVKVEETEDNPITSVVRAFGELRRRIGRFKSQLTRENLWRKQKAESDQENVVETGLNRELTTDENLGKVENYIRREIYYEVVNGNISPDSIDPNSFVDEVFMEIFSRPRPEDIYLDHWVLTVARQVLNKRISEIEMHKHDSHIEDSPASRKQWEDEYLNFFQPDESLHISDLLQDNSILDPEQLLERDEAESRAQKAIAALPVDLREAFVLYSLEGFTSEEVAMATEKTPEEVLESVEKARSILREDLF